MIFTYEDILEMLKSDVKFSYSRWGDGEWQCILGYDGGNCDGHTYFPTLRGRLMEALKKRGNTYNYFMGIQQKAILDMGMEIYGWMHNNDINIPFVDADIIHKASDRSRLPELFNILKNKNTILVGPEYLRNNQYFKNHIVVKEKNCWEEYEDINASIEELINNNIDNSNNSVNKEFIHKSTFPRLTKSNIIICYCAGMMSKVLIHNFKDINVTQIDLGSVCVPYANKCTRSYHVDIYKREQARRVK